MPKPLVTVIANAFNKILSAMGAAVVSAKTERRES